jgi:copper homeostasis protein
MIRPRGGPFVYSPAELDAMKRDIALCRELRVDGVVLGILDSRNIIDLANTSELVRHASGIDVTFHRAFDLTPDPTQALESVIASGCTRILTSGHQPTAVEGANEIASLITSARGRITILPGSGIRSSNLAELARLTHATEFHSSARTKTTPCNTGNVSTAFDQSDVIDAVEIQRLRQLTDSLQHP